jgi:methionine-rich copper-binding protein CopC
MQKKIIARLPINQITFASTLLLLIVMLIQANPVLAHAKLVKSDPSRKAALSASPKYIQLWFNEKIEGSYASVTVLDSEKKPVTQNSPEPAAGDLKSVILNLPELEPGNYKVQYRVMSVDGHVIESSYEFSIKSMSQ